MPLIVENATDPKAVYPGPAEASSSPPTFLLQRFAELKGCTVGLFSSPRLIRDLYSLELPWLGNAKDISRIPAGRYKVRRWASQKHPVALEVVGEEPFRSDVLIHPANWPQELRGCIALGFGLELGLSASVNNSRNAVGLVVGTLAANELADLLIVDRIVFETGA